MLVPGKNDRYGYLHEMLRKILAGVRLDYLNVGQQIEMHLHRIREDH